MPLSYQIDQEARLGRVTGAGKADLDDLLGVMRELAENPAFAPEFDLVADLRRLDYLPSLREIRQLASRFEEVQASFPPRVAIVVRDRVQMHLGRFAAGILRFDMSLFDDPAEADRWVSRRRTARLADVKAKILELWAKPHLAALATLTAEHKPWVRYVLTFFDQELRLRFATYRGSRKTGQIAANPEVHLVAGAESMARAERWVQVSGQAALSEAAADRRLVWHESLAPFFSGPEDPSLVAVVVQPYRIEYMEMGATRPELWHA
jgi:general stress protein 26